MGLWDLRKEIMTQQAPPVAANAEGEFYPHPCEQGSRIINDIQVLLRPALASYTPLGSALADDRNSSLPLDNSEKFAKK